MINRQYPYCRAGRHSDVGRNTMQAARRTNVTWTRIFHERRKCAGLSGLRSVAKPFSGLCQSLIHGHRIAQ